MNYLNEREYTIAIGKILAGKALEPDEARAFVTTVSKLESLLDENTEGENHWINKLGWNGLFADEPVEIVAIIDQSGSMGSVRDDAIGGFNTFLEEQQALEGEANLTLVLFDDRYEVPVQDTPVRDVEQLTRATYAPLGWTAMNDAIGKALTQLEAKDPKRAIICILTDGEENASKEYSRAQVKAKIEAAEARGWKVIFLAANMDVQAAARSMGVSSLNATAFTADARGITSAIGCLSSTVSSYRSEPITAQATAVSELRTRVAEPV